MEKDFSIIFPTRDRIYLLNDLLQSIQINTTNKSAVEVLAVCDDDDEITNHMKSFFERKYADINFSMTTVKRSDNFSRDYFNFLCAKSTGRYVIAVNDDSCFVTTGWDEIALSVIANARARKNILYGWIQDNLPIRHGGYCCFPLLSRQAITVFGRFFSERFQTWGADINLHLLFSSINAVVKIPILIDHNSYHTGKRGKDHINYEVESKAGVPDVQPGNNEINTLRKAIQGGE